MMIDLKKSNLRQPTCGLLGSFHRCFSHYKQLKVKVEWMNERERTWATRRSEKGKLNFSYCSSKLPAEAECWHDDGWWGKGHENNNNKAIPRLIVTAAPLSSRSLLVRKYTFFVFSLHLENNYGNYVSPSFVVRPSPRSEWGSREVFWCLKVNNFLCWRRLSSFSAACTILIKFMRLYIIKIMFARLNLNSLSLARLWLTRET